ncbi:MAJOR FACILITATOR SUPERFAMILY DOMAIN-CONTAINING PROTEIN [Salix viminalis]|uniref:MAJOR FACILITATOR SUPERFAMILY DOMAIN-CONTAINING PROTEIN n=2 Tax=Salix viminalis TaxID=40686 RepID=A0A9Q0NJ19_SALVM|nr:MAJOR FACILITATOR SUPERFAMILY DOMAIN-CONTAINING PROTEIN [Salix viminalis]
MVNDIRDDDSCPKPVGRSSVFYYGFGHMLNDITAACWFTYLLLFLTEIGLSPRDAAITMLAGQIADGFATVFAGELIDRFGHFKVWHGAGSILAAISFSSVFGGCLPCKILASRSPIIETISYSTSAAIFNVGWAATQVSHMSMVNCISLNSTSRVVMTSCRNAFTMVANLSLYAVALVVFSTTKATTHSDIENQYHWIAYTSIFIGCCFVGIFHLRTKEPRLAQNVSQAYLAFYVIEDLRMAKSAKALVPAIIYISSFIVSIIMQEMSWTGQRLKAYYCAGGVIWVFCGTSILFLPRSLSAFMYVISVFIGIANTLMTVTGVSMQSVLVGSDLNGCAFVYGSLSFLDKVSCGLAVFVLQSFQSSSPRSQESLSTEYISVTRYGLGLLPAVCSLAGMGITYTMKLRTPHSKSLMEPLLD